MIANLLLGIALIAAGLFPLYFNLNPLWWILGGVMILLGLVIGYSSLKCSDAQGFP